MVSTRSHAIRTSPLHSSKMRRDRSQTPSPTSFTPSALSMMPSSLVVSLKTAGFNCDMFDSVQSSRTPRRTLNHRSRRARQSRVFSSGKRWTEEEDQILCELGNKGECFTLICQRLSGRSVEACRARYNDVLDWTREEWTEADEQIVILMKQSGASYQEVAEQLPGRGATKCKYRWEHLRAMARRQMSKEDYAIFISRQGGYEMKDDDENNRNDGSHLEAGSPDGLMMDDIRHPPWTANELEVLISQQGRGQDWKEIAEQLSGRSPSACEGRYYRWRGRQNGRMELRRQDKRTVVVQRPKDRVEGLDEEGPDLLTGVPFDAESSNANTIHDSDHGVQHDRASGTHGEDDQIGSSSIDKNTVKHTWSNPVTSRASPLNPTSTPSPHAIRPPRLVPFAQRVLHNHLVAQGAENIRRNALEKLRRARAEVRYQMRILEQLGRTHPVQGGDQGFGLGYGALRENANDIEGQAVGMFILPEVYEATNIGQASSSSFIEDRDERFNISHEDEQYSTQQTQRDALRGHLRAMDELASGQGSSHASIKLEVGSEEGDEDDIGEVYRAWGIQ